MFVKFEVRSCDKMKYLMSFVVLMLFVIPTKTFADGNQLLKDCTAIINLVENNIIPESEMRCGHCAGYIQGISAMNALYKAYDQPTFFCMPDEVNNGQKIKVVIKYLNDHPEKLHEHEAGLVLLAFMEAFPCKNQSLTGDISSLDYPYVK